MYVRDHYSTRDEAVSISTYEDSTEQHSTDHRRQNKSDLTNTNTN